MTKPSKPTILTVQEHDALNEKVNERVRDLHDHGVDITSEGVTQFKIEGLFETVIDMLSHLYGFSRDEATRLINTNFLEAMDKYVLTTGAEARQEAVRQRLAVGSLTPDDLAKFKAGQ